MNKILIVGFQRSGTTLLRRLINNHPEIKFILHEKFLLLDCFDKKQIENKIGFEVDKFNWGEKVPYYPSARKIPIVTYCQKWFDLFKDTSRIIHIIRHPYDAALSSFKTFNKRIEDSLRLYKGIVPYAVSEINKIPNTYTIKYENFLLNDNIIIPKLFSFCNIDSSVDYNKLLHQSNKDMYKKLNKNRVFAYKNAKEKFDYEITDIFSFLNTIEGPEYI